MNTSHVVEYKNIRLRPLSKDDLEILRRIRNDSFVSMYLTRISFISSEMQREWYKKVLKEQSEIIFAIEEREKLKRCVGSCSLYKIGQDDALFGKIATDPEARGMKVGTNSIIAALHVGFSILGKKRIDLFVNKENHVAKKVYSAIGFEVVGQEDSEQDRMSILPERFYHKYDLENDVIINSVKQ